MRLACIVLLAVSCLACAKPPNVVLIITDDQGHGDLGCHGNPKIRTPNLDRLAKQSARLTSFHVCPVCSPTRASLMTGRYYYRTGVVDTYLGRSLMHADETTIAELLRDAGYRTGIFGKWHLGDNYPLRAIDQGFQEALICTGGGLTQPSDPPGNTYFDPVLFHNGKPVKTKGYCTDVFTDAALRFIEQKSDKPFFAYLAYNAPHGPLQVDDKLVEPYRQMNLAADQFPRTGFPLTNVAPKETTARVYAMVENVDTNLGKLFKLLDDRKLAEDTIVIFITDNGPQQSRFNSGMRGLKGSVWEGGIRVPCFVRWPGKFPAERESAAPTAHIDILPTLLDCCAIKKPEGLKLDGRNVRGLLEGSLRDLPERTLFVQWHRGDVPEKFRSFAAIGPRYKLVQPFGAGDARDRDKWEMSLFDLETDRYEQKNILEQNEDLAKKMRAEYAAWFDDVGKPRGYAPPRIHLGSEKENPVTLTRQDWRGPKAGWRVDDLGHWEVHVEQKAKYDVTVRFAPRTEPGTIHFKLAGTTAEAKIEAKATEHTFRGLDLPIGDARLETWLQTGNRTAGVTYVDVERR